MLSYLEMNFDILYFKLENTIYQSSFLGTYNQCWLECNHTI